METPRTHQNSLSSVGFLKDTLPTCPLLFCTPLKKPCSQPPFIAKENQKATENLSDARMTGAHVHNSTCSTPMKTPCGTPSKLQTPATKLSFLSANKNKHSVGTGECGVNEDASITRTPFRLMAGKNLNVCLFSPSQTPRRIAFPTLLDKLASPSLEGHAKRVLVMPQQLSAARRVPVKQKRSQGTPAGKQSPFATPKSSRIDDVLFVTPKSCRVDNVSRASDRNDEGNVMEHHDMHNIDVNYDKKNLERSAWPKRVIAFTPQQSPFATPNSSRVEHLLKTAGHGDKMMPHENSDVKHGRAELDRSASLLRAELDRSASLLRALASMPRLSSQARRVPVQQKQKQSIEKPPPSRHKEKQQPSNKKALSENPKTCKSGQRRKQTSLNEAGVLDGKRQSATKKLLKRVPKGKGGNGADKTKQRNVGNHAIKGGSSKQRDEDINKKRGDDSGADKANGVNWYSEDGKQHEACDVDVDRNEYHHVGHDVKQHFDDDGTKHQADDLGEKDTCQTDKCQDDEKQHEVSCGDASGGEHYGDGLVHCSDNTCTEQHDYHDGDDDDIGIKSNDADGEKQHGDDDTAKPHDHANVVERQHNDDGRKLHNDDDGDDTVEIDGEDDEYMKQDDDSAKTLS